MSTIKTYCRQCDGLHGLIAHVGASGLERVEADPHHSLGLAACATSLAAPAEISDPERILSPLERDGDGWREISWDDATAKIGERLAALRKGDPRALGVLLGGEASRSTEDLTTALAFAASAGTPNLFSTWSEGIAPWLSACEHVVGHAMPLQPDVTRSRFTVLLGAEPETDGWGPITAGSLGLMGMRHMAKRYKGRFVVVHPRRDALADEAYDYVGIRPGTELWFLLGMLRAILDGGWIDAQYVADYLHGVDDLRQAVAPYTVERCAAACGVDAASISGVALKFSRAPMSTVYMGRGALRGPHPTLTSWVALAVCAMTANVLRPGGTFENPGLMDMQPMVRGVHSAGAPPSAQGHYAPLAMQQAASVFVDEARGDGPLKGLLCLGADPMTGLADPSLTAEALAALDLLVCAARTHDATTQHADFVLPLVHPLERDDSSMHLNPTMPRRFAQAAAAAVPPAGQARTSTEVLDALHGAMRPPLLGGAWGMHLVVLGRWLMGRNRIDWVRRGWDLLSDMPWHEVLAEPGGVDLGAVDRSSTRVSHEDGKMHIAPPAFTQALRKVSDPTGESLLVCATAAPGDGVAVHPDLAKRLGLEEGQGVSVSGAQGGEVHGVLRLDELLRDDVVLLDDGWRRAPQVASGGPVCSITGTRPVTGAAVTVGPTIP